ncbi:MAG: hypothetical protein HC837_12625 [Chloroflexaceae bacterium]|nr:hypothetical protein [Chloroflexaceae bacterium]
MPHFVAMCRMLGVFVYDACWGGRWDDVGIVGSDSCQVFCSLLCYFLLKSVYHIDKAYNKGFIRELIDKSEVLLGFLAGMGAVPMG